MATGGSDCIENVAEGYAFDRPSAHADLLAIDSQVEHTPATRPPLFLIGSYASLWSAFVSYSLHAATVAVGSELTVEADVFGNNVSASSELSLSPGVGI